MVKSLTVKKILAPEKIFTTSKKITKDGEKEWKKLSENEKKVYIDFYEKNYPTYIKATVAREILKKRKEEKEGKKEEKKGKKKEEKKEDEDSE